MRRRFAVLLAVAFALIFGASACGGAEEEMQQRVEEQVQEATQQIEQEAQEAEQRVEQEAREMQKQVEEKIGEAQ